MKPLPTNNIVKYSSNPDLFNYTCFVIVDLDTGRYFRPYEGYDQIYNGVWADHNKACSAAKNFKNHEVREVSIPFHPDLARIIDNKLLDRDEKETMLLSKMKQLFEIYIFRYNGGSDDTKTKALSGEV